MNNRQTFGRGITGWGSVLATLCGLMGWSADGRIVALSSDSARPGEVVTIRGEGFGAAPGVVIVTGLRVAPVTWSDSEIGFVIPEDAASGFVAVRPPDPPEAGRVPFTVNRPLYPAQFAPAGLAVADTGLLGAAFLVETDGRYLYGICGFETLETYELRDGQPHRLRSRVYLNQRVGDLRLQGEHLFCAGDHGMTVYRRRDLQTGQATPIAAVAGGSYLALDVRPDPLGELTGAIIGLGEHMPKSGTNVLRVQFYRFEREELTRLGVFTRVVAGAGERQFSMALDPLNRKAYVSGWGSLTGANKYILELDISDLDWPLLNHREDTGSTLATDMEATGTILWTGLAMAGTDLFRAYRLNAGADHLALERTITGRLSLGRVTRVKILDDQITAGSAWYGERPDIFLFTTFGTGSSPAATHRSIDWAFDITGSAGRTATRAGRIVVADEWGGFMTLDYQTQPDIVLTNQPDYQWVPSAAMTENLHLTADRIYIAGRGAGPWSANRFDLANEAQWRRADWNWTQPDPQPHPVSALCARPEPGGGVLIAALGHEKAMAWGNLIYGLLYRETGTNIALLAASEELDPPGLGSRGFSVLWPETDLVFMATGSDSFRAYVVNPAVPSIRLHASCRESGFDTNTFGTHNMVECMKHLIEGNQQKLIIGSYPGLLVNKPTLNIFSLAYPDGVPDRQRPDAPIQVMWESALQCTSFKTVYGIDVRPSGLVALATSQGLAVFSLSWIPALNEMTDAQAWNAIKVPDESYLPWHDPGWPAAVKDACFPADGVLYAVKPPVGVWRLALAIDAENLTHRSLATAYYPGVECGMDYALMLHGWANPDIVTLHHPYALAADGDTAFVTGWSGKVQRLAWQPGFGVKIEKLRQTTGQTAVTFSSVFGGRNHRVEATSNLGDGGWATPPGAYVLRTGETSFTAQCPLTGLPAQFYRIVVEP